VVSKEIGSDILTVQWNWPVGKPLVDGLGNGCYEVRSTHRRKEYGVFFCISASTMCCFTASLKRPGRPLAPIWSSLAGV